MANCFFEDLSKVKFEHLLNRPNDLNEEEKSQGRGNSEQQQIKTIEFIVMVGFHHKVGSQVEYIYPPVSEDTEGNLSAEFLR